VLPAEIIWIRNVNERLYKLGKKYPEQSVEQKDFGVQRKWTASVLFYFIIIIIIVIIIIIEFLTSQL
jgi:hypothetical protein